VRIARATHGPTTGSPVNQSMIAAYPLTRSAHPIRPIR
jgi:hypothetical protein